MVVGTATQRDQLLMMALLDRSRALTVAPAAAGGGREDGGPGGVGDGHRGALAAAVVRDLPLDQEGSGRRPVVVTLE